MSLAGKQLGRTGEDAAAQFLAARGYTIIQRNFSTRRFEIDIIAKDGDTLCFVEVKTRSNLKKGLPREAVLPAKQQKIIMGASFYLKKHNCINQRVRFDVVEVLLAGGPPEITLIPNAFQGV
ncbi:MAG: YraN family protein [Desulfobacter sp.]|nr:MAG: YraN family protein [Desulfobacter sp.]